MDQFIKLLELVFISNTGYMLPIIVLFVICVIVYYKFLKPFYIRIVKVHNVIDELHRISKNIMDSNDNSNVIDDFDIIKLNLDQGIKLLGANKFSVSEIIKNLEDINNNIQTLNSTFNEHDKTYDRQTNNLILEIRTLIIKVENNLYNIKGIK